MEQSDSLENLYDPFLPQSNFFRGQFQQQLAQNQMYNLGVDNYGWSPAFADYKQILEQLRTNDDMLIYEAMTNLANQLSIAQENTLTTFPLDQYIPVLIEILNKPIESDLANESNMFVIQCLTNLMDIFPTVCGSIVNHGAVKSIADLLERCMGFIDLNEACIKCLEKISTENPYAILTSGTIALCLNMMDFFEISTQKRILNLILNVSRHSASEQDLNQHVLPLLPFLSMLLHSRGDHAQSKIEIVCHIVLRVCESLQRFVNPLTNFEKFSQMFEQIGETGIIDGILQKLQDFCVTDCHMNVDSGMIQQSSGSKLSNQTVQYILKVLTQGSRYSLNLTKMIVGFDIFRLIEIFLPSQEDLKQIHFNQDKFPFIMETIHLLDALFPEREDAVQGENEKSKQAQEQAKREFYITREQPKVLFIAEKILPKIFNVYENNIQTQIRNKALQVIDKMISLFNDELLNNFIEPYSFAKFIYSNMRGNNVFSIKICLQMIDKLMKSNPQTYTLPLMREGVTNIIKQLATQESIEKTLSINLSESATTKESILDKSEEFLVKARMAILQKNEAQDKETQLQFEQTIQKYLEASRQSQLIQPNKIQLDTAKQILQLSEPLMTKYFENEEFSKQLNEWYGEEFKIINMLKNLSKDIIEEAKSELFNFEKIKSLIKQVAECLSSKRHVMTYEFKESGLLEALDLLLTHSPKQVQLKLEKERIGEEVKRSEEMMMSQMSRNSQTLSKKESRSFIQRLKVFTHIMLSNVNDKKPIQELINLCHDLLSQSEFQIFESQMAANADGSLGISPSHGGIFSNINEDPNQSVHALRQLTKRIRVNLVYDPKKSFLQTTKSRTSSKEAAGLLEPPQNIIQKASSHHPAFMQLGGAPRSQEDQYSKVYVKRNFLFSELSQVLISVEQCASLHLLEDFLRNKIRNMDDVKALKTPSSYYQGLKKPSSQATNQKAREIIDRALDRMRDLLESGGNREKVRSEGEEFASKLSDEILESTELSDTEQIEIIRQLEHSTLQMMDEFYAEQEAQYEDMMRDEGLSGGEEEELNIEQKMYEFQRIIELLRQFFKVKQQQHKDKKLIMEKQLSVNESQVPQSQSADTEMQLDDLDKIEQELQKMQENQANLIMMQSQEEEKKDETEEQKREDVEMTDEEEDEQKKIMELYERQRQHQTELKVQREVELSVQDESQDKLKETINMDLDELIKTVGDDIEFEFYYQGQLVNQNQTIFEILRSFDQRQSKQPTGAEAVASHSFGSYSSKEGGNIYFLIKDKKDELQMSRKDSLLEFAQKRERTKSEAVNDISVSAVNSIVQQLIDKEFQVFSKDQQVINTQKNKERQQELVHLEQALKILKVLNFVCKNVQLLSNQGIKFIINSYEDEDQQDEMFSDINLQIGVSQLHANIFHHHKLDSFILKNIQDPYTLIGGGISEILQQIFRNCPFLFPFQTRQLFFKLISFIGSIDMNRSIYFLRQFLKTKLGKLPPEDKNTAVKFQKQKIIVDRARILDSAFSLVKQINKRAFLEIQYKEEAGTGLGPTLEFYCLLANEIKNAEVIIGGLKQSIWRKGMIDNSLYPAPLSIHTMKTEELQKIYEIFRMAGIMIAKSISDDRLIDLPISSLLWDLVLGKKMNIFDLERVDKDLFKIFAELQMLANKKRDMEKQVFIDQESKNRQMNTLRTSQGARVEDLSLYFTLPGYDNIELKQNGRQIEVNLNNLQEYVDLVLHFIFHETVKIQIQALKKGFNSVFPVDTLKPFSTSLELEDMICGVQRNDEEWTNTQRMIQNVVPAHGYHSKSSEYLDLIKFMGELNHEERRKFLKFVTGSPRLPNGGFSTLDPKLTVVLKKPLNSKESPDDILPSVMTCQNYIKLPSYSSYEKLKARFEMAYNEGTNNFTLS